MALACLLLSWLTSHCLTSRRQVVRLQQVIRRVPEPQGLDLRMVSRPLRIRRKEVWSKTLEAARTSWHNHQARLPDSACGSSRFACCAAAHKAEVSPVRACWTRPFILIHGSPLEEAPPTGGSWPPGLIKLCRGSLTFLERRLFQPVWKRLCELVGLEP